MSALLRPFTGYFPTSVFAHRVVAPQASTLSADQREAARNDPLSFRYSAGRSAGVSQAEAVEWLAECQNQGALRPVGPAVLAYRQGDGDRAVTGIVADVSLSAYNAGLVKRHEKTIAKTARKMADYMRTTRIYGNPVALAHRPRSGVNARIAAHTAREADTIFTTVDGLTRQLWAIEGDEAEELCREFNNVLNITDGHHRLAAAALVATQEGRLDAGLPVGVFSADQLTLRSFARCVVDPDLDADTVIERLRSEHRMQEVSEFEVRPGARFEFGVKIRDRYFKLQIDRRKIPDDHYQSLDVNLLQNMILGPVFGITNPRRDKRLRFVADVPGASEADNHPDAWLLPLPVAVDDVIAVADSGQVMPAKSTWFAPKVPSGLVVRLLDRNQTARRRGAGLGPARPPRGGSTRL
jgi:uncharacterized protein (DUF1015 family)